MAGVAIVHESSRNVDEMSRKVDDVIVEPFTARE